MALYYWVGSIEGRRTHCPQTCSVGQVANLPERGRGIVSRPHPERSESTRQVGNLPYVPTFCGQTGMSGPPQQECGLQVIPAGASPALLFLRVPSLVFDSAPHRCPGGPGGSAGTDRFGRLLDHLSQLLQTVGRIPAGIAKPLARNQQVPFDGDPPAAFGEYPLPHCVRQARAGCHSPAEQRLGVHFVDVLSARPAAAGEGKLELPQGDLEMGSDDEHSSANTSLACCSNDG